MARDVIELRVLKGEAYAGLAGWAFHVITHTLVRARLWRFWAVIWGGLCEADVYRELGGGWATWGNVPLLLGKRQQEVPLSLNRPPQSLEVSWQAKVDFKVVKNHPAYTLLPFIIV